MNKYELKLFEADLHYDLVSEWWAGHNWPIIPLVALPKTAFIVEYEGAPVCAGWLYLTDSIISWAEWIISAPDSDPEVRGTCLDYLLTALKAAAKSNGSSIIFTTCNSERPRLIERYEKHGYTITDKNMTNLIYNEAE